jgi:hypothetical protein
MQSKKQKAKSEKTGFEKIRAARNKNNESNLLAADGPQILFY